MYANAMNNQNVRSPQHMPSNSDFVVPNIGNFPSSVTNA